MTNAADRPQSRAQPRHNTDRSRLCAVLRGFALLLAFLLADGAVAALLFTAGLGLGAVPASGDAPGWEGVALWTAAIVLLAYLAVALAAVLLSRARLRTLGSVGAVVAVASMLSLALPAVIALVGAGLSPGIAATVRYAVAIGLLAWLFRR